MNNDILYAFLLTTLAGLSTSVGGIIGLLLGSLKKWQMALIMGFSAGVMLYISFIELLPLAVQQAGVLYGNLAFFIGIIFIAILDIMLPHEYKEEHRVFSHGNTESDHVKHQMRRGETTGRSKKSALLMKTGVLVAIGIGIHNVPEGLAVFSSTVAGNATLGLLVAIAVALHNIPEGIIVFEPIYEATGNKKKAFLAALFSGLAEPLGAVLGFTILLPFINPTVLSCLLAFAAGIMVYISLDELLPASYNYDKSHVTIIGIFLGMLVMTVSFILTIH